MHGKLEVLTLSVSDVDRAVPLDIDRAYTGKVGFALDVDYRPHPGFRVVQLTPPGSASSIQFGVGLTDAPPGSARATYLAVDDLEATHRELTERGVPIGAIRHKSPLADWQGEWMPGIEPEHRDYASVAEFADPDGNTWLVQEIGYADAG